MLLGEHGRNLVEGKYTLEAVVKAMVEGYKDLVVGSCRFNCRASNE